MQSIPQAVSRSRLARRDAEADFVLKAVHQWCNEADRADFLATHENTQGTHGLHAHPHRGG